VPILHNRRAVQEMLRLYLLEEYPPEAEQLGHGMLFVSLEGEQRGQLMSLVRLHKLFEELYSRTGIRAHPHLFRHTFSTRMLQKGYPDQYVQQLLGHHSISTTKDMYSRILSYVGPQVLNLGTKLYILRRGTTRWSQWTKCHSCRIKICIYRNLSTNLLP